jgi:Methyltransferase domain
MDLKEEHILGDKIRSHWYYVAKGRAMRAFLGRIESGEVLDVGAGSGVFSRQLIDEGLCDRATCVDPNYTEERIDDYHGKPIEFVRATTRPAQKLILMMDVLEHVSEDVSLLRDYTQDAKAGALVLITVPAFQFMWSGHDVFLDHHRRYTIATIEAVVRKAGLTPIKSRYFFGSLFVFVAAARLMKNALSPGGKPAAASDLRLYPDWLNAVLIGVHDIERRTLFRFNRLFGLSVFCLCRKNHPGSTVSDICSTRS